MLSPYALCTYNDTVEYLQGLDKIPTAHQVLLERLINQWSRWAADRCNRFFGQSVYVNELHSGTGRQIFMMHHPPVWSVSQISMLTAPGAWGLIIDPTEYWVMDTNPGNRNGQVAGGGQTGMIWRERGWWAGLLETPGLVTNQPHPFALRQNISSTYVGGWTLHRDFGSPTATGGTGGALTPSTSYYYRITQTVTVTLTLNNIVYTVLSEPLISPEFSVALTSGQGSAVLAWTPPPPFPAPGPGSIAFADASGTVAYGYRIYRGAFPGGQSAYYSVAGGSAASFTDIGAASTSGLPPTELPDDLRGALLQIVAAQYKLRAKQGISREIFGEGGAGILNIVYDRVQKDALDQIDLYRIIHTTEGI